MVESVGVLCPRWKQVSARSWLLAVVLLAACSGSADSGATGSRHGAPFAHRVELALAEGLGAESVGMEVVQRYLAPDDLALGPWEIADSFDGAAFNRVVVTLTIRKPGRLRIFFKQNGKRILGVPGARLEPASGQQIIVFDMPSLRRRRLGLTELEVGVESGNPQYRFHGLDLVRVPVEALLPSGGGALASAEGEARRVIGVTSERALEGIAPLVPGCMLTLSLMHPEKHRFPGQRPRVLVSVRDVDGVVVEERVSLDSTIGAEERWHPVRMDLSRLSGDDVWIRVSLEVRGEAIGVCLVEAPYLSVPDPSAPTVLLITSDTHRADALGVVASERSVQTPYLDALAARSVRFSDCYSSTNVTSPSHVSIMTGTSPRDTGIITNTGHMAEAAVTLAERFRERGYVTYGVASVRHLGPLGTGLGQGFDRMAAPRSEVWDAEVSMDRLDSWLGEAVGRPLFVWLHLFDAHAPYAPPPEFDRRYYPEGRDPFDAESAPEMEFDPDWLEKALPGLKDPEFALAQYRAEVDYLDAQLGRLLERPRFRDGVVAFTADHGESFGSGGVWFSHVGLFPSTLHVPLLLSWPEGPRGLVVDYPVENMDLARTLLDLAGFQAAEFPGKSLLAAVEGVQVSGPRFALSANGKCAAVFQDGWQLTLNLRDHDYEGLLTRERHQVELFHLEVDPDCKVDVWEALPERTRSLQRTLMAWLVDTRGSSWAQAGSEDEEALAQLAALGYTMDVPETEERVWVKAGCACEWCARVAGN